MALNIPDQVFPLPEIRHRPAVQYGLAGGVEDIYALNARRVVPVHRIERDLVRKAVDQVHIRSEVGGRIPRGRDPVTWIRRLLKS